MLGTPLCLALFVVFSAPISAYLSNPQLENENGNLVFTAADSRNISFKTLGGIVLFNGLNLADLNRTGRQPRITASMYRTVTRRLNESMISNVDSIKEELAKLNQAIQQLQEDLERDECESKPCSHNAVCIDGYKKFTCKCPDSWTGDRCNEDVNECFSLLGSDKGCQNGASCVNSEGSFRCDCAEHWFGALCTARGDSCKNASNAALCGHGTCLDQNVAFEGVHFKCLCDPGWQTDGHRPACTVDINECQLGGKCDSNVQCINTPGSFACGPCPRGYNGNGFKCTDNNECLVNNGGCSRNPFVPCLNLPGSFTCDPCPPGYSGDGKLCSRTSACVNNNCNVMARCVETPGVGDGKICQCPAGHYGNGIGPNGCQISSTGSFYYNPCSSNPCNNGNCTQIGRTYHCQCSTGRIGINCEIPSDACSSSPCLNNGICTNTGVGMYLCDCPEGFTGDRCGINQLSCGGELVGSSGVLKYPAANVPYVGNLVCEWVLRSNDIGKVISLKFVDFHLEYDHLCSYDSLEIFDSESKNNSLSGKKCGVQLKDTTINSTGHVVFMVFRTDETDHGDGFTLHWFSLTPECGEARFNVTSGVIQSPGYPGNYPHNSRCRWSLEGFPGTIFNLRFEEVKIEPHPGCQYDYLEIRDGLMEDSPLIQRICNPVIGLIKSKRPAVHLYFHSDPTDTDKGFRLSYNSETTCGGTYTQESGNITSPGFPYSYERDLRCTWLIAPGKHKFILSFPSFDLENDHICEFDFIEIRRGDGAESPLVGKYCNEVPAPIEVYDSSLYIYLETDDSVHETGFRMEWKSECVETFENVSGYIRSPDFPSNYPPNQNCIYSIKATYSTAVMLAFSAFNLEERVNGVCSDYLLINSRGRNEKLCGTLETSRREYTGPVDFKFVSDDQVQKSGFLINYLTRPTGSSGLPTDDEYESSGNECECGCFLRKESGFIVPPSHFEADPHEINCTWTIEVNQSHVINLKFTTMDLEFDQNCAFDFVEVFDDIRETRLLGKYCGTTFQEPILSSTNVLVVRFQTDHSDISAGFRLDYSSVDMSHTCGRTLTMHEGDITSPGFPDVYEQKSCEWIIKAEQNKLIHLKVLKFVLEDSQNCIHDFLEIRNGGFSTSPSFGKYCGTTIPTNFTSHGTQMYLKFRTDDSIEEEGFHIHFDSTTEGCGGILSSSSGSLTSPNYPSGPSQLSECFYKIITSAGSRVNLYFMDFDIPGDYECIYSYVKIRKSEHDSRGTKLCGSNIQPVYKSDNNVMLIDYRFVSRDNNGRFAASFHTDCNVDLSALRGSIESPNYPGVFHSDLNCKWTIGGLVGNKLVLNMIKFKMNSRGGCSDSLQILDASGQLKEKICNDTVTTFEFDSANITVQFVSAEDFRERDPDEGFKLDYRNEGCGEELEGNIGSFTSPNYPEPYKLDQQCHWVLRAGREKKIQLTIEDIDIENSENCLYDYLKIYNGANDNKKISMTACHSDRKGDTLTSITNTMFIDFKSDSSQSGRGFNITWQAINNDCTHYFTVKSASISSPNYPGLYPMDADCSWKIETEKGSRIKFEIKDFEFEPSEDCQWDYLALYNDFGLVDLIAKICGQDKVNGSEFYSDGNTMLIHMVTDDSLAHIGFLATYSSECGGVIKVNSDDHGSLHSPSFPQAYPSNLNCTWVIKNQILGDKLNFEFVAFQLEEAYRQGNCTGDSLKIYNGEGTDAPLYDTYCGLQAPPPFTSAGSTVTLRFYSDGYESKSGFNIIYTRSNSVCGLEYKVEEGTINSPSYPGMYPHNSLCTWNVTGSRGSHIEINFLVFDMVERDNCTIDRLEISYGNTTETICSQQLALSRSRIIYASSVHFVFQSGQSHLKNFNGFSLKYKIVYGGHLSNWQEGVIESPNYPLKYHNDLDITWILTPPNGQTIRFIFDVMDLEKDHDCYDYIQITEGIGNDVEGICGTELPDPFITTHTPVKIRFVSDSSIQAAGFVLTWKSDVAVQESQINTLAPPRCGGDLVLDAKSNITITSANYPNSYDNDKLCEWQVASLSGFIQFSIVDMRIEEGYDCTYDYLKIVDVEGESPAIKLCGFRKGNYIVRSSKATLTFKTDQDTIDKGFKLFASTVCDRSYQQNAGVITSPNYNGDYPVNMNCSSYVSVDEGQTISLTFSDFDVACSDPNTPKSGDYIEIFEGPEAFISIKVLCGQSIPPPITSSSNKIVIRFIANSDEKVGKGFKIIYMATSSGCGNIFELTDSISAYTIQSPNYPQSYPSSLDCVWVVTTNDEERLAATFNTRFKIDRQGNSTCNKDKLIVRDGGSSDSALIGTYCGDQKPEIIRSSGSAIYFRFISDLTTGGEGFYVTLRKGVCGGTYIHPQGSISSPNYPNDYPTNQFCQWTISVPVNHYVTLTFEDLDIADCNDKLVFRDFNSTGPEIATVCSSMVTIPSSAANVVVIMFTSDNRLQSRGFKINYLSSSEVCGGELSLDSGTIQSPNYPLPMNRRRYCEWIIVAPRNKRVTANLTDFNIVENDHYCQQGYFLVLNGKYEDSPKIFNSCRTHDPMHFKSTYNVMQMRYFVTRQSHGKGFRLTYNTVEDDYCNAKHDRVNKVISMPRSFDEHAPECLFQIDFPSHAPSKTTSITFDSVPALGKDCENFWEFEEYPSSRKLGRFCESNPPPTTGILSVSSVIKVRISSRDILRKNMTIRYNFSECGGNVNEETYIESSTFPLSLGPGVNCLWQIIAPFDNIIKIIPVGNPGEASDCNKTFVEIKNGLHSDSPVIVKDCKLNSSLEYLTQSNMARVGLFSNKTATRALGFRLKIEFVSKGCGGWHHGKEGVIRALDWPNQGLKAGIYCSWHIRVPLGYHIQVSFSDPFQMPRRSGSLCYDYIEVISPFWNTTKYCGLTSPGTITVSTNEMDINLNHNPDSYDDRSTGFQLNYTSICGANRTGFEGKITTPDYPSKYHGNTTCTSYIYLPNNQNVSISIAHYYPSDRVHIREYDYYQRYHRSYRRRQHTPTLGSSYCPRDYIEIGSLNDTTQLLKLCNNWGESSFIMKTPVFVKFVAGPNVTEHQPFSVDFRLVDCDLTFNEEYGTIRSPHQFNLQQAFSCKWLVHLNDTRMRIRFRFSQPPRSWNCRNSALIFKDVYSNNTEISIIQFCGYSRYDHRFYSKTNKVRIEFNRIAHRRRTEDVFQFDYQGVFKCGGEFTAATGSFEAFQKNPGQNAFYEPNLNCVWSIRVRNESSVHITFKILSFPNTTGQCEDYLEIYDNLFNSIPTVKICDNKTNYEIVSATNIIKIHFVSDSQYESLAMKAEYKTVPKECGGILNINDNEIKTLSNPSRISRSTGYIRCQWEIKAEEDKHIQVDFSSFDLPLEQHCSNAYLHFSEYGALRNLHARLCGNSLPHQFISFSNHILLIYYASDENTANTITFTFKYQIQSCNQVFNASGGSIKSIGFPARKRFSGTCNFTINALPGYEISLMSKTIYFENYRGCEDYLEISSNEVGTVNTTKVCDSVLNQNIPTNHATISYVGRSNSRAVFSLTYLTHPKEDQCGGYIDALEGTILSPKYPGSPLEAYNCTWTIGFRTPYKLAVMIAVSGNGGQHRIVNFQGSEHGVACSESKSYVRFGTSGNVTCFHSEVYRRSYRYRYETTSQQNLTLNYVSASNATNNLNFQLRFNAQSINPENQHRHPRDYIVNHYDYYD